MSTWAKTITEAWEKISSISTICLKKDNSNKLKYQHIRQPLIIIISKTITIREASIARRSHWIKGQEARGKPTKSNLIRTMRNISKLWKEWKWEMVEEIQSLHLLILKPKKKITRNKWTIWWARKSSLLMAVEQIR